MEKKSRRRAAGETALVDAAVSEASLATSTQDAPSKRQANALAMRKRILYCAARIVGRYGYSGASVARIAARAKIAQGTFYNHFKSRQELFDVLLPEMGELMLAFFRDHIGTESRGAAREEERLRAYLSFLQENPWYHRVLNEAEVMAPKAYQTYFQKISKNYAEALERSCERGEIQGYRHDEFEAVAYILMSMRLYLAQRYATQEGRFTNPAPEVVQTFAKFVERALFRPVSGNPETEGEKASPVNTPLHGSVQGET